MKLKVGDHLEEIRKKKGLTQEVMGDLLSLSQSAYARLEQNETMATFEDIVRFAKILKVPVQDLLPEIFTIHNNPTDSANGIVFGSDMVVASHIDVVNQVIHNHYYTVDESTKEFQKRIEELEAELQRKTDTKE